MSVRCWAEITQSGLQKLIQIFYLAFRLLKYLVILPKYWGREEVVSYVIVTEKKGYRGSLMWQQRVFIEQ